MKEKEKKSQGITLIALVITIIVLLILAGITIATLTGDNGILSKATTAKESTKKEEGREIIKLAIEEMRIEKLEKGEELTLEYIADNIHEKLEIPKEDVTKNGEPIESIDVIYGDYSYNIDQNYQIEVFPKGNRPKVEIIILDQEQNVKKVRIQVKASTEEGEITTIESVEGLNILVDEHVNDKTFEATRNGKYSFKIITSTGKETIATTQISNIQEAVDSLLKGIEKLQAEGEQQINIEGKADYNVNVILYKGDLVLDGKQEVKGATLANNTYEFGDIKDVATEEDYAKNTVVLKVEGNLTVQENVVVTAVKSAEGYGGPKGLVVYCTGELNNYGTISMTARGAKAQGEDVYLWKNTDDSYEYVPAVGATGGASYNNYRGYATGRTGNSGTNRATGGGGSGGSYHGDSTGYATSVTGGRGTSYSGGTGSGGINVNCQEGPTYGRAGSDEGGQRRRR